MKTMQNSSTNQEKIRLAHDAWQALLATTLTQGFFGTAELQLVIQDGTIQYIRRRVEQMDK